MQTLDVVFVVLLGLLVLRGFLKGFVGELFPLASVAMGIIAAVFFFKNGAVFLRSRYLDMDILPEALAFLVIFLIVFIAGKLVEHIVTDIIKRLKLHTINKALGLFLGVVEGFALILLVLFLLVNQPLFDPASLLEQSRFAQLLLPFLSLIEVFRV